MDKINKRYLELAEKWMNGTITPEEKAEFSDWYNKNQDDELVLENDFAASKEALGERIFENINNKKIQPAPRIKRFNIMRFAAAAAAVILVISGTYFFLYNKKSTPGAVIAKVTTDVIAPSNTKAVITLPNGQKILLDSAGSGTLASFDQAKIIKNADGEISYVSTQSHEEEPEYNTLDLPRGSKVVNLTLPDGTKVWLNSESRLRFPVVFSKKERKVEISGEAYFEVAKDPKRIFYVISNGITTEVLGTQFNVNTYATEAVKKITLLEGAVKVKNTRDGSDVILKPGQQARLSGNTQVISGLDAESEVAWKDGLFSFIKTDMAAIMRQIERWYNVSVEYEDEGLKKKHFTGEIPRSESVSHVLHMLELTNTFHFKIEGRKILITK